MTSRSIRISNQLGMHARAAARFVHAATTFECHVRVTLGGREMDGKSIMGILLLAAARGSVITITTSGTDEARASEVLCGLVESGFGDTT
ncbi:MAG: HPr family phosphocarrier protein [Acidobacteria bacterium]|nr:HPr family phosphocarrier protein [Acidobacteriota bacterium]